MTNIKEKALALLNEVLNERGMAGRSCIDRDICIHEALCRAIEVHEAPKQELADFKQKVSDAVAEYKADQPYIWKQSASGYFSHLILPAPKPDPLVEVLDAMKDGRAGLSTESYAKCFRAALDALGFEIKEKKQ
jgi:hypothetical protein